ncbi:hypothetical protein N7535_000092 [Penicillium sp. DV-2018c]|nr:hypothetical protein N7535_000092 [Penicillium sp. DV-2018c]
MARDFTSKPFRDVVREHRGLLVDPLRWTPHHLELLGCRFEDAPTTPVFPETPSDQRRPPERPGDAETLTMSLWPDIKCCSLENILLGEEPKSAKPRDSLGNMSFGLVGYLHYASIDGARCRQFEPRSGVAIGSAGLRYCQKQLAQAFPKDRTEDPYFLCVLLGLAQMKERKLLGLSKPIIYTGSGECDTAIAVYDPAQKNLVQAV